MDDLKLLGLAAKSINCTVTYEDGEEGGIMPYLWGSTPGDEIGEWNPLTDDGDALRLAVKLDMLVSIHGNGEGITLDFTRVHVGMPARSFTEEHNDDAIAATRRAIVRAAAEIGRAMP